MARRSMALPVLSHTDKIKRHTRCDMKLKLLKLPHDVGPRWLLVGEGLRAPQTGLVSVQEVSNRRAGRAVFTWMVFDTTQKSEQTQVKAFCVCFLLRAYVTGAGRRVEGWTPTL